MDTYQQQPIQGEQNISDEKRQQLFYALDRLKAQAEDTKMRMNAAKNSIDIQRKQKLREVFGKMEMNGVDLTSRESVAGYIDKVKRNNPATAQSFESGLDYLLTGENNMNNTNQNEAIPQDPRGYNNQVV